MTLFITVRSVARSRDFYSRVLGGTVVLDENPCIVRLSNSWIIMNPGGPPTPDKQGILNRPGESGDSTLMETMLLHFRHGGNSKAPPISRAACRRNTRIAFCC